MEVLILVILLILNCIGLIISIRKNNIEFTGIYSFILGIIFIITLHYRDIRPIDVYRNNTTLEITYKDGVAIDSVVVWKNK